LKWRIQAKLIEFQREMPAVFSYVIFAIPLSSPLPKQVQAGDDSVSF